MSRAAEIMIRELGPNLLADYLAFFDNAFSDYPDWADCYCGFYDTSAAEWDTTSKAEHRTARSERIRSGKATGLLAYIDGKPVGWCNAQPRSSFPNMRAYKVAVTDPDESVGSIMCFLVAPSHRSKGVSNALLNAACDNFKRDGLQVAEGYPPTVPKNSQLPWAEANYKGPLNLYLKNGFSIHRQVERFAIVRKQL